MVCKFTRLLSTSTEIRTALLKITYATSSSATDKDFTRTIINACRYVATGSPRELEAIKSLLKHTPDVNLQRSHRTVWITEESFDMIEVVIHKIDNFSCFVEIVRRKCVDKICCRGNVMCTLLA